jgi:hypothetical protein
MKFPFKVVWSNLLTCRQKAIACILNWGRPNIAITRGSLSARLLVVAEEKLGSDGLWAKSRRIDGQPGV